MRRKTKKRAIGLGERAAGTGRFTQRDAKQLNVTLRHVRSNLSELETAVLRGLYKKKPVKKGYGRKRR